MSRYKKCSKGHSYPSNLQECPYCNEEKNAETRNTGLATQIISSLDGEQFGTNTTTEDEHIRVNASEFDPHNDYSHTVIDINEPEDEQRIDGTKPVDKQMVVRKLVGWLVTYDLDPNGIDFRLYEGRNIIGRDFNCEVCINDPKISSRHAVIRYLRGSFKIKDELSANGTRVNGDYIDDNISIDLKDGDAIYVGDTMLIFRAAFKMDNK